MKIQRILITILSILIFSLFMLAGWKYFNTNQTPKALESKNLKLPNSAIFFPKDSVITLHWMVNPNQLPKYARSIASSALRKNAEASTGEFINGLFSIVGLDFNEDLSYWIGEEISFSLFDIEEPIFQSDWLLTLSSKEINGAEDFLARFWESKSLNGVDISKNTYRGINIINGSKETIDQNQSKLSTALIDKNLVLISSSPKVIKTALDTSQSPEQNQLEDNYINESIDNLGEGIGLLISNRNGLNTILGIPDPDQSNNHIETFITSIKPEQSSIGFEGLLKMKTTFKEDISIPEREKNISFFKSNIQGSRNFVFLQNPSKILSGNVDNTFSSWIGPYVKNKISKNGNPIIKSIFEMNTGPILWLKGYHGWEIITENGNPKKEDLNKELLDKGFTESRLNTQNGDVLVWSKLITKKENDEDIIDTEVEVILKEEEIKNIWAENLLSMKSNSDSDSTKYPQNRFNQLKDIEESSNNYPLIQIALDEDTAKKEIINWQVLKNLQLVSGKSILSPIKGLYLELDNGNNNHQLTFRGKLRIK